MSLLLAAVLLPLLTTFILWFKMTPTISPSTTPEAYLHYPPSLTDPSQPLTLLIAHPDDESMFFAPTLTTLTRLRHQALGGAAISHRLRIWCLSDGDAEGLGSVRKRELERAAEMLGVSSYDVVVLSRSEEGLVDEMGRLWSADEVGKVLEKLEEEKGKSGSWLTFDKDGVSGHANHRSVQAGLHAYLDRHDRKDAVWELETVSLGKKYSAWLEAVVDKYFPMMGPSKERIRFASDVNGYLKARQAMVKGHVSQMVWFRWGWISLGRYMYVNTIVKTRGDKD